MGVLGATKMENVLIYVVAEHCGWSRQCVAVYAIGSFALIKYAGDFVIAHFDSYNIDNIFCVRRRFDSL